MQPFIRTCLLGVTAIVALLVLSACTFVQPSAPSQFYVLSDDLPAAQEPLFKPDAPDAPVLVVGIVRVAAFLDRPQMTVRRDANVVSFDEFARWAEPLTEGVARVLRANFVSLLGTPESALPWARAGNRDFNLFVFVEDIQQRKDGQVELRLSFRISDGSSSQAVLAGERTYLAPAPQGDTRDAFYASLAGIISQQLGQFSLDIARDAAALKAAKNAANPAAAANPATAAGAPATTKSK